jgi:type IV secretion system protein TrbB
VEPIEHGLALVRGDARAVVLDADRETAGLAREAARGVTELDALLWASLRLRQGRIIVGEVRGPEALELVRSLNIGHREVMAPWN